MKNIFKDMSWQIEHIAAIVHSQGAKYTIYENMNMRTVTL